MAGSTARSRPRSRIDQLAARVRWLDRYRRLLAVVAAAVTAPVLIAQVADVLGADLPELYLTVVLGVILWWTVEVALAYATALWETEHDRLVRDRLPRAIVRKWR